MPNPREVSDAERQAIWDEVRAEFPADEMMREIHFVRAASCSTPRFYPRRATGVSESPAPSVHLNALTSCRSIIMNESLAISLGRLHAEFHIFPAALFNATAPQNIVRQLSAIRELRYLCKFYKDSGNDRTVLAVDVLDHTRAAEIVGRPRSGNRYFVGNHDQGIAGEIDATDLLFLKEPHLGLGQVRDHDHREGSRRAAVSFRGFSGSGDLLGGGNGLAFHGETERFFPHPSSIVASALRVFGRALPTGSHFTASSLRGDVSTRPWASSRNISDWRGISLYCNMS